VSTREPRASVGVSSFANRDTERQQFVLNAVRIRDRRTRRYRARGGHRTQADHRAMTDDEVVDEARVDGFELIERMSAGRWAVGWARGADDRWRCFLEERQAINGIA